MDEAHGTPDAVIEPDRPIIDPHLHLWDIAPSRGQAGHRFLLDEARAMLEASGHHFTHTVYVECSQMYRPDGPEALRSLGETEFATGIAAMSASGAYGPVRINHRIVAAANLRLGDGLERVIEQHRARAGERLVGFRDDTVYSAEGLWGFPCDPARKGRIASEAFITGARVLARLDLGLDLWCVHTQLPDVIALADAVPDLAITLDHLGTPECTGRWADTPQEAFAAWRASLGELAQRANVRIKLGGMGMNIAHGLVPADGGATSRELAELWRARIEVAVEAFSPRRAMFESNFPPDRAAGSYGATWNAFKRIACGWSDDEKDWLFRRTAAEAYRIDLAR